MERDNIRLKMKAKIIKLNYQGNNLLFLEDVIEELKERNIPTSKVLYRASEKENLERIIKYGTDRGGFTGKKLWQYSNDTGKELLHENVIYATTEEEIRKGELEESFSTSLKKFLVIEEPLLLVYDSEHFVKIREKQYAFLNPQKKHDSLLAIFIVKKEGGDIYETQVI